MNFDFAVRTLLLLVRWPECESKSQGVNREYLRLFHHEL
jgi:hypothetical protein